MRLRFQGRPSQPRAMHEQAILVLQLCLTVAPQPQLLVRRQVVQLVVRRKNRPIAPVEALHQTLGRILAAQHERVQL